MSVDTPRDVVFVDVETNGRDPRQHRAWEVAAWNLTTGHRCEFFVHIPDMSKFLAVAEPVALRVGKFLDRYPIEKIPTASETRLALTDFGNVLDGGREIAWADEREAHPVPVILGSNPAFDIGFLRSLLLDHHRPDPESKQGRRWHYHPIDLGSYAAGVLGRELGTESLSAESVARMCGVEPGGHSAGGDVTSGAAAYLLLREAARVAAAPSPHPTTAQEWLAGWRLEFANEAPASATTSAIKQFGPDLTVSS